MSSITNHNKKLAKKTKDILAQLGYKISLGHAYELISQLSGFPNWDTASAKKIKLLDIKVEEKTADPVLEELFDFVPRTPEDLQNKIWELVKENVAEEDGEEEGKHIAISVLESIEEATLIEDGASFLLWDSLGYLDSKEKELSIIYGLAGACFQSSASGATPDREAELLLKETVLRGFNKKKHLDFLKKRAEENNAASSPSKSELT